MICYIVGCLLFHFNTHKKEPENEKTKHEYCCQNTARNLLDHFIPIPDNFNVNPNCLYGLSKDEFIGGLRTLTEIIQSMYSDMIQNPAEYGLPLVEDIVYEKYNPKAAASGSSPSRLITTLYSIVHCGDFANNEITVNKKLFTEKLKTHKAANVPMILKKLCDNGFIISGFNGKSFDKNSDTFTFSYADGGDVVPALYGYMLNAAIYKVAILSLNYFLAIPQTEWSADLHTSIFAKYLSGSENDFYVKFNRHIVAQGLHVGNGDDYNIHTYRVEYFINPKDKSRFIACYSEFGQLRVSMRLRNIDRYANYLETLPERVKQVFRKESTCRYCQEPCGQRYAWTFEGVTYTVCGYMYLFDIISYEPEDAEIYKQIIMHEVDAVNNKGKK